MNSAIRLCDVVITFSKLPQDNEINDSTFVASLAIIVHVNTQTYPPVSGVSINFFAIVFENPNYFGCCRRASP